jgi:hypothetical protein
MKQGKMTTNSRMNAIQPSSEFFTTYYGITIPDISAMPISTIPSELVELWDSAGPYPKNPRRFVPLGGVIPVFI